MNARNLRDADLPSRRENSSQPDHDAATRRHPAPARNHYSINELRQHLAPYRRKSSLIGLTGFAFSFGLYGALFIGTLMVHGLLAKILLACATGLAIGLLFIIAHDAGHGSPTNSKLLNRCIATLSFLPHLQSCEVWDGEHNRAHHGWTNLATRDAAYIPLTHAQYLALPAIQRWLHRLSFTAPFAALQYLKLWWHANFSQRDLYVKNVRRYRLELVGLIAFCALQAGLVWALGAWSQAGPGAALLEWACAVALPFYVWNSLMAFSTIQQHTHPDVPWYDQEQEWKTLGGRVRGTVRMAWPRWFDFATLNLFVHTAHHVDPQIPWQNLPAAQAELQHLCAGDIKIQQGSPAAYLRTLRICRLYDYREHRWVDWNGHYLSESLSNQGRTSKDTSAQDVLRPANKVPSIGG